jgi:hypothetical protein
MFTGVRPGSGRGGGMRKKEMNTSAQATTVQAGSARPL